MCTTKPAAFFFFSCWLHPWHMDVLSHSLDLCYSWRNTLTQCTKQELPTALYNYCTWEFIMYILWVFKTVIMEECNEKDFQVFFFFLFLNSGSVHILIGLVMLEGLEVIQGRDQEEGRDRIEAKQRDWSLKSEWTSWFWSYRKIESTGLDAGWFSLREMGWCRSFLSRLSQHPVRQKATQYTKLRYSDLLEENTGKWKKRGGERRWQMVQL